MNQTNNLIEIDSKKFFDFLREQKLAHPEALIRLLKRLFSQEKNICRYNSFTFEEIYDDFSEKKLVELVNHIHPDRALINYYERYLKIKPESAGKAISQKTFWLTGDEVLEEEPATITDHRIYQYKSLFIVNSKGGCERIIGYKGEYGEIVCTQNNEYKNPCKISQDCVHSDELIHGEVFSDKDLMEGCGTIFPYKCEIVEKDNGVMQVKVTARRFIVLKHIKRYTKDKYYLQLSYNLKTGKTYMFGPTSRCDGTLTDGDFGLRGYSARRYNLDLYELPDKVVEYAANIIAEYKKKTLGFKPTFYRNCFNSYEALNSFNRNPLCNPIEYIRDKTTPYLYEKMFRNSNTACDDFIKLLGLKPSKVLRKLFFENIMDVITYASIYREGYFTNPDEIIPLLNKDSLFSKMYRNVREEEDITLFGYYPNNCAARRTFYGSRRAYEANGKPDYSQPLAMRDYHDVKLYTEDTYFKKICNLYKGNKSLVFKNLSRKDNYEPWDTIRMLERLEAVKKIDFRRKKIPFNTRKEYDAYINSMFLKAKSKKHHDDISFLFNLIAVKNEQITYSKEEKLLEKKKGSYVFYLPKNTQTLAHVGKDMNMCVGAYARQAKEKICTIVLLDVAGEHKVCMELRENRVVQVKKYGNALVWPKYPEWNVINQWMIDNQLDTSRCKDFHGPINERRKITNY